MVLVLLLNTDFSLPQKFLYVLLFMFLLKFFIGSLIVCAICFDHIYLFPQLFQIHLLFSIHPTSGTFFLPIQFKLSCLSNDLLLFPQVNALLSPHWRHFCLQQIMTNMETRNWQGAENKKFSRKQGICITCPPSEVEGPLWKSGQKERP